MTASTAPESRTSAPAPWSAPSRFALYRAFRAEFGLAPSGYQRQLRLRHARSLLVAGTAPADAAAAAAAGFAGQAHFGRWFQRMYGITPGTFVRARV